MNKFVKSLSISAGIILISGYMMGLHSEAAANKSYVESGKIVWADKKLENFEVKIGPASFVKGSSKQVDGFVFGKGQQVWIEYKGQGKISKIDSYDPSAPKTVLERFKITSNKNGKIRGDLIYSQSGAMGNEGIYLDKTYKHFDKVKDVNVGEVLDITWTKKDYDNEVWDNIYSVWEESK